MNRLVLTIGLPRSGKSTWARQQGVPIVCPDAIRLALHGQPHCPQAEPMVWLLAKLMVESLFLAGHDQVILDATNIRAVWRDQWYNPAWEIAVHIVPTTAETCIARALANNQPELVPVIDKMNRDWKHEDQCDPHALDGVVRV